MISGGRFIAVLLASICLNAHAADPFHTGFQTLRNRIAVEQHPTNGWSPKLRLLVGVEASEGEKSTVCFVELTTTKPPLTNKDKKPWAPILETNSFAWTPTNQPHVTKNELFIWSLYPVQVRVFDERGHKIKEGTTTIPFGLLTNGLLQVCRLSMAENGGLGQSRETVRAFVSGFLWMGTMMGRLQSVPELKDVWDKANCSFRWPSFWTMTRAAVGGHLELQLNPEYNKITPFRTKDSSAPMYVLPLELVCNGRTLTRVETVVAPASGAAALLGGFRSIVATHPTKPDHKFTARVLAEGIAVDTSR